MAVTLPEPGKLQAPLSTDEARDISKLRRRLEPCPPPHPEERRPQKALNALESSASPKCLRNQLQNSRWRLAEGLLPADASVAAPRHGEQVQRAASPPSSDRRSRQQRQGPGVWGRASPRGPQSSTAPGTASETQILRPCPRVHTLPLPGELGSATPCTCPAWVHSQPESHG